MSQTILQHFNTVVITGGGGGLGKAMAEYLIKQKKKVIIVGRTESNLQETKKEINAAAYYVLDTGDIDSVPGFVEKLTKDHPDVDCIINNAGVQRPLNVLAMKPDEFLTKADQEIAINIKGPMHLILHMLPHLRKQKSAVIMNVSSVLGFIPFSIINPVYNGTKAWVHLFSMNLRTQLKNTGIKVVEIVPPAVGTDLHRERADPDDNKKDKNPDSLSIDEFMDDISKGWEDGRDTISAGIGKQVIEKWFSAYGAQYEKSAEGFES